MRRREPLPPCIVFIDELDGMCGHRGHGGVGDRVISQLLTELDGLPTIFRGTEESVMLVAATNRPDNIDGAVLRPGRIDRMVYVALPGEEERAAIARIGLRKIPTEGVSPEEIAKRTAGYTGAEVIAVCKESAFIAIGKSESASAVSMSDVDEALQHVRPRIKPQDVAWYAAWQANRTGKPAKLT